jgi:ketosteroid isomerase-like protein
VVVAAANQTERGIAMKNITRIATCAAVLVLVAGCNPAADQGPAVDSAAVEKQLRDIETQWEADYNAHNIDALAAHYADDAALANPGSALATDAASRKAAITQFVADPSFKHDFAADRVQVAKSGDLAYTRGHYIMETTDPATKKPKTETGTYLTVWQKQADGSWKAVEDAVIPGAPAAKAAAAGN